MLKIFVLLLTVGCAGTGRAIIIDHTNPSSIRLGLANALVQNPAGDSHRRSAYSLAYQRPIFENTFTQIDLQFVPDLNQRSERVAVKSDTTNLILLGGFAYPILFRLNLAIGACFTQVSTKYQFDDVSRKFQTNSTGVVYKFFSDYAINKTTEVSLMIQLHQRPQAGKFDRYYGITLNFNIPHAFQTESRTW